MQSINIFRTGTGASRLQGHGTVTSLQFTQRHDARTTETLSESCPSALSSSAVRFHPCDMQFRCNASKNSGGNSSNAGGRGGEKRGRRARVDGQYEIQVVTPPAHSLGVYLLPPNTHNGEEIEIEGEAYVVTCTCIMFKLDKGKYVRDHSRLDVQPTSRYILNAMLDDLITRPALNPTSEESSGISSA